MQNPALENGKSASADLQQFHVWQQKNRDGPRFQDPEQDHETKEWMCRLEMACCLTKWTGKVRACAYRTVIRVVVTKATTIKAAKNLAARSFLVAPQKRHTDACTRHEIKRVDASSLDEYCQRHGWIAPAYAYKETGGQEVECVVTHAGWGDGQVVTATGRDRATAKQRASDVVLAKPETWFERLIKEEVVAQSHTTLAKTWLENYLVHNMSLALDKPQRVDQWFVVARAVQRSWEAKKKEPFLTGLDTEFVNSKLATIQIAIPHGPGLTSGHVLVLSLSGCRPGFGLALPACLVNWLSDAGVSKLCLDPTQDVKLLARWMPSNKNLRGIFNVADMAPASWCLSSTCGMERLANRVLSVSLKRSQQVLLSNWLAWPLSRDQLDHAALDAILACEMAHCLGQKKPILGEHKDDGGPSKT